MSARRRETPLRDAGGRTLLIGAFGMGNTGDEAILAGLLAGSAEPRSRMVAVSGAPAETTALHGIAAVAPRSAPVALLRCERLVIGGGGLFSAHVGPLSRTIPAFGLTAVRLGKRVAIRGVSIDHSTPRPLVPLVHRLARAAETVVVRDRASAELLRRAGIACVLEPDFSTLLQPAQPQRAVALLRAAGVQPGLPAVALCLTAVEPRLARELEDSIPRLLAAYPGVQFCFVPMSRHRSNPAHNDLVFARRLQRLAPGLLVLDGAHHPAEVLATFGQFSAAVCMRYHSLLFAQRWELPIVGVPYAPKCESWLREADVPATPPTTRALIEAVGAALAARETVEVAT